MGKAAEIGARMASWVGNLGQSREQSYIVVVHGDYHGVDDDGKLQPPRQTSREFPMQGSLEDTQKALQHMVRTKGFDVLDNPDAAARNKPRALFKANSIAIHKQGEKLLAMGDVYGKTLSWRDLEQTKDQQPKREHKSEAARIYLDVPYDDRNEAKRVAKDAGFHLTFDGEQKSWYARARHGADNADLSALNQWMPKEKSSPERQAPETKPAIVQQPAAQIQPEPKPQAEPTQTASKGRVYLAVAYEERNEAKQAAKDAGFNLRFDRDQKSWYAPGNADLSTLSQWMPKENAQTVTPTNAVDEFAQALRAKGLVLDGPPKMDGKFHRVPVEGAKNGKLDGAYKGHLDGVPAGFIQNHKTGERANWKAGTTVGSGDLSERAALAQSQYEREQGRAEQYRERATHLTEALSKMESPGSHPYTTAKQVDIADGVKVTSSGRLAVPVTNVRGRVQSVQYIGDDGEKKFAKDAQAQGGMFIVGKDLHEASDIGIAEGYATAMTAHKASGLPVVSAFNAGNLMPVASELRRAHPNANIHIFADNDIGTTIKDKPVNVGVEKAQEVAKEVKNVNVIVPQTKGERGDFNDVAARQGIGEVKKQIAKGIDSYRGEKKSRVTEERPVNRHRREEEELER